MAPELVIFDCDGVLFESERANVAFYNAVLAKAGLPALISGGEAACHALSSAQLFENLFGDRPAVLERIRAIAQALDYGPFYRLMQPRPGLHRTLTCLRRSYKTALATNRGKTVRGVLEHFDLDALFDLAIGVLDVPRPKPCPDLLLRCLEFFELQPEQAVYVGDQPIDAACAHAAGVRFIAMGPAVDGTEPAITELSDLETVLTRVS